jgi:hypothetical protein
MLCIWGHMSSTPTTSKSSSRGFATEPSCSTIIRRSSCIVTAADTSMVDLLIFSPIVVGGSTSTETFIRKLLDDSTTFA